MMDLTIIPAPAYVKTLDGFYQSCNSLFLNLLGFNSDEWRGKNDFDLFPKPVAEQLLFWDLHVLREKTRQCYEVRLINGRGEALQALFQTSLIEEEEGAFLFGVITDLTTEKRSQEARSASLAMAAAAETAIQTIEGMIDPVIILNRQGRIERINRAFVELFGFSEPVVGKEVYPFFPLLGQDVFRSLLARCEEQGRIRNLQTQVLQRDGKPLPVLLNISLLRDSQHAIDGFILAIRDISNLVETTEQLKEKEQTLDAILNASEEAVVLVDRRGTVRSANRALSSRYQRTVKDMIGLSYFDLLPKSIQELQQYFVESILNSRKPQQMECEEAGHIYYNSGYPIFDDQGNVSEVAIFSYDVTDEKKSEQLQRALYSISEAAYFARDMYTLFKIVHRIINKLISVENLHILLLDEKSPDTLHCPYYVEEGKELFGEHREAMVQQDGLISFMIRQGQSLLLTEGDIKEIATVYALKVPDPVPRQWLGVPLKNGEGTIIGALVTHTNKEGRSYSEDDRRILNFVSSQIAMAIERKMNEERLRSKNAQLKMLTEGIILSLVQAVEIRDPYTAGHQQRVASLAEAIARKMGLHPERVEATRIAALLHDVGKIAVPSELLSKPGKLSELELALIRQHPVVSYNILRNIQFSQPIAQFVLEHHEKMNGSGYPAGLEGENINLESRIICVADVVDSLASHRPYRPARGIEQALQEIQEQAGILYDAEVVKACCSLFKEDGFMFGEVPLLVIQDTIPRK